MAKKKEELEKEPKVINAEETTEHNAEAVATESEEAVKPEEHKEEEKEVIVSEDNQEVGKEENGDQENNGLINDKIEPVVGEQSRDTPKLFPPYAYDLTETKEDTQQEKLFMQQGLHYLAEKIKMKRDARKEKEMIEGREKENIMYYGTYSVDWTDMRYREIGKTIPEIAYLNYWAPQRCIMLNVEWLPRLVADGYILKDLTPGTWEGYINERNIAKYMKKVDYLLRKGKIRP